MKLSSVFCCAIALLSSAARGESPDVKAFEPSGAHAGDSAEIKVAGKLGTRPVKVWCSRRGVSVTVPEEGDTVTVTVAADARPGVYGLRFYNAEGASALRPFVIGTLPEILEKEPNNAPAKPQQLDTSRAVVTGALAKSGDADVFAVSLKKGETLVSSLEANRLFGSPMDGVVQVVSPEGFVLEQNDDARGLDPLLTFTAPADGTYSVRVFAFPETPNSSIRLAGGGDYRYRLTVTTGAFVDHCVPLAVQRGKETAVRLSGWNIPPALVELTVAPGNDEQSVVLSHPELGNTLELPVMDHDVLGEREPNDRQHAQQVPRPVSVTGRIDAAGDIDVYAFSAKKGEKLRCRVESRSLGYALDAVLTLLDAEGKQVARVDDPSRGVWDATLTATIPADGAYRVEVSDLYNHGGLRYAYRFTIDEQKPGLKLETPKDAVVLTHGTPLKMPVTVTRENGLTGDVTFEVTGLPEGIEVTAPISKMKAETEKKIEITLLAKEPVAIDKPFRIIGTTEIDGTPVVATATAPIEGLTRRTSELWATVKPPEEQK